MSDYDEALEAIGRMVRNHPETVARILANAGGHIRVKAAVLTPVDTGLLMVRTKFNVETNPGEASLTVYNDMIYAHYQHENKLNHPNKPTARDHFISIPFEDELPRIVDEIVQADLQEART